MPGLPPFPEPQIPRLYTLNLETKGRPSEIAWEGLHQGPGHTRPHLMEKSKIVGLAFILSQLGLCQTRSLGLHVYYLGSSWDIRKHHNTRLKIQVRFDLKVTQYPPSPPTTTATWLRETVLLQQLHSNQDELYYIALSKPRKNQLVKGLGFGWLCGCDRCLILVAQSLSSMRPRITIRDFHMLLVSASALRKL